MPAGHKSKIFGYNKSFNTNISIWARFRKHHKNEELTIKNASIIYKHYNTIGRFETHVEAIRTLSLVGYKVKQSLTKINEFENVDLIEVME